MKLQIGQRVFVKKIGNAARYLDQKKAPIEEYVEEATVSKIGRKWFKVVCGQSPGLELEQFSIETGWHDGGQYSGHYIVYESMQEIYDEIEDEKVLAWVRSQIGNIGYNSISRSKLRAIKAIIEEA